MKSFSDYKSDASNWITLEEGEYYPDILKDACALYEPVLVRFGQFLKSSESSSRLFLSISDDNAPWMRIQLLRVFRRYVCPALPVEMTKQKKKAAEIEKDFREEFRPVNEVQKMYSERLVRDEVMCALLWEHNNKARKGYTLTERWFEHFRSNFIGLEIQGPPGAGRDILGKEIFANYPSPNCPFDFVIKGNNDILAVGFARYDADRGGSQEDDRIGNYTNNANEFLHYTEQNGLKTKLIFINDGPGLLVGSMWDDYSNLEKKQTAKIMVLTLRMVTERITKEWLNAGI